MKESEHDAFVAGANFHARIATGAGLTPPEQEAVERQARERYDEPPVRPFGNETRTPDDYEICVTLLADGHITPAEFYQRTGKKPL